MRGSDFPRSAADPEHGLIRKTVTIEVAGAAHLQKHLAAWGGSAELLYREQVIRCRSERGRAGYLGRREHEDPMHGILP
jgi:hypothetical protein